MKKKILGIIVGAVIAMQLVPYGKGHSNPPVVKEPQWDSVRTKDLFSRACGDCHSNGTKWPWYSNVAPVSWLVQHDVKEGREKFNVSVWGVQKKNEGEEAAEEMMKGDMPPWFYVMPHPEAKLSEQETSDLINGLKATFAEKESGEHGKAESGHEEEDED